MQQDLWCMAMAATIETLDVAPGTTAIISRMYQKQSASVWCSIHKPRSKHLIG